MTVEERFEKLEKQNRKLRKLGLTSVAIALAGFIGGTALSGRAYTAAIERQDSITTKAIYLKDTSGRTRVALIGATGLVQVYDGGGRLRMQLNSNGDVRSYDANGKARAVMTNGPFALYDANGKARAVMTSSGYVTVHDSTGRPRVMMVASDNKIYYKNASGGQVAVTP